MYDKSALIRKPSESSRISKSLGKRIDVYQSRIGDNAVVYLNGRYLFEFLTGEPISQQKIQEKIRSTGPIYRRDAFRDVEKRINRNQDAHQADDELRKRDAALDAMRIGANARRSINL